jgi:hypothetical protein
MEAQTMLTEAQIEALAKDLFGLLLGSPTTRVAFRPDQLAIPCAPTEEVVSQGMHKHRCSVCSTTWKHDNNMTGASYEQFCKAHSCPTCGAYETEKFGEFY